MLKKFLIIVFFSLLSFAEVITSTSVKEAEGVGIGTTREEAVSNAIAEAMGQISGVQIDKRTFKISESIKTNNGHKGVYTYNSAISRVTKGRVDSFSILEVNDMGGQYEARVSVTKKKVTKRYKTPGLNPKNRRSIVIVSSYPEKIRYSILNELKSGRDVGDRVTQELVSSITKTRKLTVLDRESYRAYRNEMAVILSGTAGTDELLKFGQVLGADYLLVSKLTEFSVAKDNATSAIAANMSDSYKANATVQYRIIAMATRQIKWSNTMSIEFEPEGNSFEQVYLDALKKVSENITTELMENIYPIKLVNTSSGQITLNQGSLEVGQEYDVYSLGKRIIDSYTKESLGRTETKVGKIKVVRSLAKMSVAEVIEGSVSKGNICRTSKTTSSSTYFDNPTEADYGGAKVSETGGVILPFD